MGTQTYVYTGEEVSFLKMIQMKKKKKKEMKKIETATGNQVIWLEWITLKWISNERKKSEREKFW